MTAPRRVVVFHASYGCETGCCGHVIQQTLPDGSTPQTWTFDHPYGGDPLAWAKQAITDELGPDHAADLDWDHCEVSDD